MSTGKEFGDTPANAVFDITPDTFGLTEKKLK